MRKATSAGKGVSPAGTGTDALDRRHLSRYTLDNVELECELVELFLSQLPVLLKQLVKTRSRQVWKVALHTLRGSASAIGAVKIIAITRKMEGSEAFQRADRRKLQLAELHNAVREFEIVARKLHCR